jgi:hypothetical protein
MYGHPQCRDLVHVRVIRQTALQISTDGSPKGEIEQRLGIEGVDVIQMKR